MRGPDNRIYTEQVPSSDAVVFQTAKGRVNVMVYDNSNYDNVLATHVMDSDRSVIVKNSYGQPYIVRAKYGTIWTEE